MGLHGGVLLGVVALRDNDGGREPEAAGGKRHALAVVAPGGADGTGDVRPPAPEPVHGEQPPARLEGADGGVVLVLDPDLGPD